MSNFDLRKAILCTLAYFDIFEYPLTLLELYKWLYYPLEFRKKEQNINLMRIKTLLDKDQILKLYISQKNGFYFLKGKEYQINLRQKRYRIADKKFKKALKITKLLCLFPFVRLIAICNNLAYDNAREESDIDFFVITSPNRIWTCRFYIVLFAKLFVLRPKGKKIKDRFCFSFFVSEQALNLEKIQIEGKEDIYLIYWLSQIAPLWEENKIFEKFKKENKWINKVLPNVFLKDLSLRRKILDFRLQKRIKKFLELIHSGWWGEILEIIYKKIQKKILPSSLSLLANKDSRVILNEHMLKFHKNDRRLTYYQLFVNKCQKFSLSI